MAPITPEPKKNEHKTIVDVIKVVQHGDSLVIPENLPIERAIKVLQDKQAYDEEPTSINAPIEGFLLDAAHAFFRVLEAKFGWAQSVPTPGFFGDRPPMMVAVPTADGSVVQVPWGRFKLPGVEGFLETGAQQQQDRGMVFVIGGTVKRKHEKQITEIVDATKAYLRDHSVYRGQAFRIRLKDENGDWLQVPEPKFLDLSTKIRPELIFSDEVRSAVETSLFAPIEFTEDCRKEGIPLKRGILLSGPYGCGKSMTARAAAEIAVEHGWTYIVCERADELAEVLRLARMYGPAIVFCEDIDRVMSGRRSIDMDEILNIIDGVESKGVDLMVVLTTNHVDKVNQAMLRPGRLDAVIHVAPPDEAAVERLMRQYGRGRIPLGEDISEAAKLMAGQIPATVREVVERSKLAALRTRVPGESLLLTAEALIAAAQSMRNQIDLLERKEDEQLSDEEKAARILADAVRENGNGVLVAAQRVIA